MKVTVTLSRAHKISERIKALRATAAANCQRQCSGLQLTLGLDNIKRRAKAAKIEFDEAFALFQKASNAYTEVRKAIDAGNRIGVSNCMAEREQVRSELHTMRTWMNLSSACALDQSEVTEEIEKAQPSQYGAGLAVRMIDLSYIKTLIKDLEKKESQLSDQIADLNAAKIVFEIDDAIAAEIGLD